MWNPKTLYTLGLLVITSCPLLLAPQLWHVPTRKPFPSLKCALAPGFPILVTGITIPHVPKSKTWALSYSFHCCFSTRNKPPPSQSIITLPNYTLLMCLWDFPHLYKTSLCRTTISSLLDYFNTLVIGCPILSWVLFQKFPVIVTEVICHFELTKSCHWLLKHHECVTALRIKSECLSSVHNLLWDLSPLHVSSFISCKSPFVNIELLTVRSFWHMEFMCLPPPPGGSHTLYLSPNHSFLSYLLYIKTQFRQTPPESFKTPRMDKEK